MADFSSEAAAIRPPDHLSGSVSHSSLTATREDEQFLRLRLSDDTPVLLPIPQLSEVLTIPASQIMPIPDLPAWAMGVYNWRGDILWIIDLGHLCGLTPWYKAPTHRSVQAAVVLDLPEDALKSQTIGLVVGQIEDIESCPMPAIQPWPAAALPNLLPDLPPQLQPFAAGYWQKSEQERFAILDGRAILRSISAA